MQKTNTQVTVRPNLEAIRSPRDWDLRRVHSVEELNARNQKALKPGILPERTDVVMPHTEGPLGSQSSMNTWTLGGVSARQEAQDAGRDGPRP